MAVMRPKSTSVDDGRKEASLALKGLSSNVTESMLTTMFRSYGKLQRIKLDGFGGAHVVFSSRRAAERAFTATNGALVDGKPLNVAVVRPFTHSNRPCRSFQQGLCQKGNDCKYLHITDEGTTTGSSSSSLTSSTIDISTIPKERICRHFAKGSCLNGEKCHFAHIQGAGPLPLPPPRSNKKMCSFYAVGKCQRGDQCVYQHEVVADETIPIPATSAKPTKQEKLNIQDSTRPTQQEMTDENDDQSHRSCTECEQLDVAVWKCTRCADDAQYCDACDALVHTSKVMRQHVRTRLAPLVKQPACDECETKGSIVRCNECQVVLCENCDRSVHRFKTLQKHERITLNEKPATNLTYVESIPQYTLPSDSDSEDEDTVETKTPLTYVDSVPQYDLSSESESSEDEQPTPCAQPSAPSEISSESSDDDFQDERPQISAVSTGSKRKEREVSAVPKLKQCRTNDQSSSKTKPTRPPGISTGSTHTLVKRIEAYAAHPTTEILSLDSNLNGFERLLAHDCAERLGLSHTSRGEGLERHIIIAHPQ